MTYDLAVWEGELPETGEAAAAVFEDLCDRNLETDDRPEPTPRIRRYVEALLARWPDIDGEAGASSPWASAPLIDEAIGPVVHFPMAYSQAEEAAAFAATLAWANGLVCFDPQYGCLRWPPFDHDQIDGLIREGRTLQAIAEIRTKTDCSLADATAIYEQRALVLTDTDRPTPPGQPFLLLTTPRGRRINNPSPDILRQVLAELGSDRWFAILERRDGWFIQVGYGPRAGTRSGWYALEHQHGGPQDHYRTVVTDLQEVAAAFIGFAIDDPSWTRRFSWQPYEIEP